MSSYPTRNREFKKIAKKFKNTIVAFFQAKISWGRPRKRENKKKNKKKIIPMSSNPIHNRKFQKNSKKIQKIKKHYCGFFPSKNVLAKAEKERK